MQQRWSANLESLSFLEQSPTRDLIWQAKDKSRFSLVDVARTGRKATMFTTLPGDTDIAGSKALERTDVYLCIPGTAAPSTYGEGIEQWWAHSVMFPDSFQQPLWHPYVVFDFHNTGEALYANMHLNFQRIAGDDKAPGLLRLQRFFGDPQKPTERYVTLGALRRNDWYDFVYHVRWSSGNDGFFTAWLNGRLVMDDVGPTLYKGQSVYMKLANYHLPFRPGVDGTPAPSSVIHDRVRLGPTWESVAL